VRVSASASKIVRTIVAKAAIDKELTRFRLRHSLVCEILGEPNDQDSMLHLALDLGWLNTVGIDAINPRKPVYAFFHPTFQEYFAARSIDDWDFFLPREHEDKPVETPEDNKHYRIFEPQWKEVILLWLGQDNKELEEQRITFIEALEEFNDGCRNFYKFRALFLASSGIAEFNNHPNANKIITKIAALSFGHFDSDSEQWITFLDPLEESARLSLIETDRQKATSETISLLASVNDEETRYEVANLLGKLDRTNKQAVLTLVELLQNIEAEWLCLRIVESLFHSDYKKPELEKILLSILKNSESDNYRRDAAHYLLQIKADHQEAIEALISLLRNSQNEILRWGLDFGKISISLTTLKELLKIVSTDRDPIRRRQAGMYLAQISIDQLYILETLFRLLKIRKAVLSLFKVNYLDEQYDIKYLKQIVDVVSIILTTKNRKIRRQSIWELLNVGIRDPKATKTLLYAWQECFEASNGEYKAIKKILEVFEIQEMDPVMVTSELLENVQDPGIRALLAVGLNRIAPENPDAVDLSETILRNLLNSPQSENNKRWLASKLKEVNPTSPDAKSAFIELLQDTKDWNTAGWSARNLGEISNNNLEVIQILFDLLISTSERRVAVSIMHGLKKVFDTNALALLVTSLKGYLNDETRENDFPLYSYSFEILWHCASRMPYPNFYTLWHGSQDDTSEGTAGS